MKVFVPRILTGLVACLIAVQTAQAQNNLADPGVSAVPGPTPAPPLISDAPGQAVAQNYFGYTEVDKAFEPLIRVDTRGGTLYGQGGFTRLSAFLPYWLDNNDALYFLDIGAFADYNPSGGVNLGAGWRYYLEDLDRIIGLNGWYDFDAGNQDQYHQFGLGFESLGRYVDYRVNGYIPVGHTSHSLRTAVLGPANFSTNYIMLNRFIWRETAYRGFDYEMGGPTPFLGKYGLNAYAGGYFFTGLDVGNVTGVSARIQGQINDALTVGAQVTHDSVFDTNAQVQVSLTIPDGGPSRWFRQQRVQDRLTAPVHRNYRVVANEDVIVLSEAAINPRDNQPYFIVHVDPNLDPGTGTGQFEDPYAELAQFDNLHGANKSNVDIIYVRPRSDGTSEQLNTGVTLLAGQRLLSTGVTHTFDVIPIQAQPDGSTTYDLPTIDGFDLGDLPVLSNDGGGNVVTFATGADGIEVSGFIINGSATGNGIYGLGNRQVNINRNTIQSGDNGVYLQNLAGNLATGTESSIDQNSFIDNEGDGFVVVNDGVAEPLEIFVTRNIAIGNEGNGFAFVSANGSSIGGIISGNSTAIVDPTTQLQNLNSGLFLFADGGTIDFYNPLLAGGGTIDPDSIDTAAIGGTDTGTDDNIYNDANDFSDNGNFGISVISTGDSTVSVRVINNDISRNSLNGLGFVADSGTSFIAIGGPEAEEGNRFLNNGLNGIFIDLYGTAQAELNIQNNTLTQNGANGIGGGGGGGGVSLFDIEVIFNGGLTASQQAIFALAAAKWESIIVGDVPDINGIDDVQIGALGDDIDGPGGILGFAGPTGLRPVTFLPYTGDMTFDAADLADLEAAGQLDEVILHEMGHVLGLGTIWTDLGLLTGAGGNDPRFTGANATREYNDRFGVNETGVPVENTGGGGTRDAHWRESTFDNELMTGFLNSGVANPISRTTVGQWEDLGYQVNYNAAEPYARTGLNSVTVPVGEVLRPSTTIATPTVVTNPANLVVVGAAIGDGININIAGTANLSPSTITDNTVTQSARHGLFVQTAGTSTVPNLEIRNNTFNNNGTGTVGSGVFLQKTEGSLLNATVDTNDMSDNLGDGFSINAIGDAAPPMTVFMNDNTFTGNTRNGTNFQTAEDGVLEVFSERDVWDGNGGDNQFFNAGGNSQITGVFNNVTITGSSQAGVDIFGTGTSIINLTYDSPTDPLFDGTGTTISGNGNGILANISQNSYLTLNVLTSDPVIPRQTTLRTQINDNTNTGVRLNRSGASLIEAFISDTDINSNGVAGIQFYTQGAAPTDPSQPNSPDPNRLVLLRSHVDENGSFGLDVSTLSDSMLVVTAVSTTFDDNGGDGVRIFAGDASNFGNPTVERSVFDNVSITGNGGNGMRLFGMGNNSNKSNIYIDINSDSGTTEISDNAEDGIHATVPYGTIDLLVRGTTLGAGDNTLIQRNGDDGIELNVSNFARDGSDDAIYVEKFPPNADPIVNVVDLTSFDRFNGTGLLTVDTAIIGDLDPVTGSANGNAGNGIELFNSNSNDFAGVATSVPGSASFDFIVNRAGFLEVNVNNSVIAGNAGDGINLLSQGTDDTFDPGNLVNMFVTNSSIANNGGSGVNILLNGKHGDYTFSFAANGGYSRTESNEFVFDNNVIESNGGYGLYYEANAGAMTRRDFQIDSTSTSDFWGLDFFDPSVVPGDATVFDPDAIGTTATVPSIFNAGYNSGINLDNYLSMVTDINSNLTFTNNQVRFNGTPSSATGDGVYFRLGTNTYLSADLGGEAGSGNGNTFSGNAGADVRFGSFVAYDRDDATRTPLQPPVSTSGDDTAVPPVPDHIFLDDTAQLDLRFNNNTGSKIDGNFITVLGGVGTAGLRAAQYDNVDPFKGSPGGQPRATQMFQVDDGFNLNANNNWTQDIEFELNNESNFKLRNVADPLFPNPDFPLNYFESPGDPFLP